MDVTCKLDECDSPADRKGYCQKHYMRQYRHGSLEITGPRPKPCARCAEIFQPKYNRAIYCSEVCRRGEGTCEGCGKTYLIRKGARGRFCSRECWYEVDRASKPCPVCGQSYKGSAMTCSMECGRELRRRSHPTRLHACEHCGEAIVGKKPTIRFCSRSCSMLARNHRRGGRALPDGTRRPHPTGYIQIKVNGAWIMEHRHIVEQQLGRVLESHERVHHKDGRRDNNDPLNLELWKVKGKKDPAGVRQSDYHCPGCRCGELTT